MIQNKKAIRSILRQISDILLINGGFSGNLGLYTGETGLVLFFFHYARHTQNELYADYGFELIEKIQSRINKNSPTSYKDGLAGIGSAVEYLVQNGFIEADTDEILEDFDKQIIFSRDLALLPIEEINDLGYYAAWRMSGTSKQKDMIQQTVQQYSDFNKNEIHACFAEKTYGNCMELIDKNIFWNKDSEFQNGLSGWGMALLTELSGDDSWIPLFPYNLKSPEDESISV